MSIWKLFGAARAFIKLLWESKLVELPQNIDSRNYRFNEADPVVKTTKLEK